jgi:hypothetical protein
LTVVVVARHAAWLVVWPLASIHESTEAHMNRIASHVPAAPPAPIKRPRRPLKLCSVRMYRNGQFIGTIGDPMPLKRAQRMCRYFNWLNRAGPLMAGFRPFRVRA